MYKCIKEEFLREKKCIIIWKWIKAKIEKIENVLKNKHKKE